MLKSQVQAINEPPPRTWADYERGCIDTFRGGHEGKEAVAFVQGMRTVFRLLKEEFPPAEVCQAAPDLLEACKAAVRYDESIAGRAARGQVNLLETGGVAEGQDLDALYNDWIGKARAAIAAARAGAPDRERNTPTP